MKVHNPIGSKERLFEMFGHLSEMESPETKQILNVAIEKLSQGALKAEQGGSVEAKMLDNYVGINGYDRDRNMYNFNFKMLGHEGDQDGVEMINDVILERFYYQNPQGGKVIELEENQLQEFNDEHGAKLFDIIEEYIDVTPPVEPNGSEEEMGTQEVEMDETMEKKIDSQPYGGSKQEYQDGMGYGDEKPVNPKLRVDAPELKKFVQEEMGSVHNEIAQMNTEKMIKILSDMIAAAKEAKNKNELPAGIYRVMCSNGLCLDKEEKLPHIDNPAIGRVTPQSDPKSGWVKEDEEEKDEYEISGLPDVPTGYGAGKQAKEDMGNDLQDYRHMGSNRDFERDAMGETGEPKEKQPEGWKDVDGFFQDDGGVMKWTQKPEGEDATTLELPNGEPEAEVSVDVEEPSLDPEDSDGDGDMLPGGKADDADVAKYDAQQILKGMEVEMEHTDDPKVALEITMDHLEEFGDYYTRLDSMEKEAEVDLEGGEAPDGAQVQVDPDLDDDAPEELRSHFQDIGSADKELEDAMLGFKLTTPNANKDEQ